MSDSSERLENATPAEQLVSEADYVRLSRLVISPSNLI
jgi:hypothetical protein